MEAQTRYAVSGDVHIAYQVIGDGPLDLVIVPNWLSHVELGWEEPAIAETLRGLARFARLIAFDRRGSGMSEGSAGATLDAQIDDVLAVTRAAGSARPALLAANEGGGVAAMFAAAHPESVRALVLFNPMARMVSGDGYEFAESAERWEQRTRQIVASWGTEATHPPTGLDEPVAVRRWARYQRFCMGPGSAAATRATIGATDVRSALPSIQCPTLVLRRVDDRQIDPRHARYVADHLPGARLVELPGSTSVLFAGDREAMLAEIERFLTGAHQTVVSERVLATVLFTDIVGSTERAAQLGDGPWRSLLARHDTIVREEVQRHRGRLVKSLGDGALATFDGPSRAISSATAIRDRIRELDLEIRAGLHTGECELLTGDDVGGLAVHIAARISGLARAGEVLVSSTVRDLTIGSAQTLIDRGEHELKGVPGQWQTFAVKA